MQFEIIKQFLNSYFHQDIETPLQGLEEFLQESNHASRAELLNSLDQFFNDKSENIKKEKFIQENCELNFNHLNMSALDWLDGLYKTIKSIQ